MKGRRIWWIVIPAVAARAVIGGGAIYIAYFAISGEHVVMAKWLGDSAVEIALIPEGDKIFRSEQRVGDVTVPIGRRKNGKYSDQA